MVNLLNGKKINTWVFWPPFILFFAAAIFSLTSYQAFTSTVTNAFNWTTDNFGWMFALCSVLFLSVCVIIAFSSAGTIKFGGKAAKPEFTSWNWFAMSLCAGIGTGIVFWGAAEPILHLAKPPASLGLEPFGADAAMFSISTVFLHWTFIPYAMYILCAIPIALAYYNYNQPLMVSSGLYFLVGDKCQGKAGTLVDILCLYGLAGGMATSLGAGLLQIGSGMNFLIGTPTNKWIWLAIAAAIIISYTISSYSGLQKGIRVLSDQNAKIFVVVMLFIFFTGPTKFILELGVQGTGHFITNFFKQALFLSPVADDGWPTWWSLYYWANWMAFGPIVGLFLVRLTYGRTIRQFILVNLFAPAVFGIIWFSVFGGASMHAQLNGIADLSANMTNNGVENAIFGFFKMFPFGTLLSAVFLFTVALSFTTLADSMTSTIASMSTKGLSKGDEEAPVFLKVVWGILIGIISWVMISYAGVDGFKMISNLAGFPIMFVMLVMGVSICKGLWWSNASLPEMTFLKKEVPSRGGQGDAVPSSN
jgi:choline/carnitine/betaine transport